MAFRNSYKTTSVIIVGTIWFFLFNPNDSVLLLRKTYSAASSVLLAIARHYQKNDTLKSFYRDVLGCENELLSVSTKDRLILGERQKIGVESSLEARGIGDYGKTGSHYDRILVDDSVTLEDRYSYAVRESTKRNLRELINIAPSARGKLKAYMGTPWHEDDAYSECPAPAKYPIGSVKIEGLILNLRS